MSIRFLSSVLFVEDMEASRRFYEELLGQEVDMDFGVNVGYKSGFALWLREHAEGIIYGGTAESGLAGRGKPAGHALELYFETDDLEEMLRKLGEGGVSMVHPIEEAPWGQRAFRVYDPDGYMVELGEDMNHVVVKMNKSGMSPEEVAQKTGMPMAAIQNILDTHKD